MCTWTFAKTLARKTNLSPLQKKTLAETVNCIPKGLRKGNPFQGPFAQLSYRSRKFAWTLWINVLNLPLKGFKKQVRFFCFSKKLPTPTPPPNPSMLGSMDFWRIHKVDPGIPLLRDTHFGQFDEDPIIVPIFLDLVFCHPKPLSSRALPVWNSGYPPGN